MATEPQAIDAALLDRFDSYEAYLQSFVTEADLRYLPDAATARRVVELGYLHGDGELLRREEWEAGKAELAARREAEANPRPKALLSAGRDLSGHPLLHALAERELPVRRGSLATIVFLRDRNAKGQEVSGYIDLGQRLAADEAGMAAVFALQARLLPQPTDLSCFNWATNRLTGCASANFEASGAAGWEDRLQACMDRGSKLQFGCYILAQVVTDPAIGLAFKCRRNRKLIVVDPAAPSPGDYTTRTEVATDEYEQAVIFDHVIGRRT